LRTVIVIEKIVDPLSCCSGGTYLGEEGT